ncbi:CAP domain-containing protein [Halorientalis regularis]|uniref:Uncharacterized conserved protein YkwD, contains CAP (CSP/antigen 5/PR1) domain n=1 Tax=Halorientalis regularis TaxID=660518 RepID=A0A1G7TW61_9EURY|nr:CAP domain-containing protein [Halorientalis regularis]SDG38730.1 Uncharacterized conserved protein YkwD, contains CAP (CSP/antigen 5/PR1) domain [Halorientalis regularis]
MDKGPTVILGVIIAIVLTAAIAVGVYTTFVPTKGSSNGPTSPTPTEDSVSASTPTPIPEQVPTRSTPEANSESTPSIAPEEKIRNAISNSINNYRSKNGLPKITMESYLSSRLTEMANIHSKRMMEEQSVGHRIQGNTTENRYTAYGLNNRCSFPSNSGYSTIDTVGGSTELISRPIAPAVYENEEGGYAGNSTRVAHNAMEDWKSDNLQRRKLEFSNADQAGIGVSISKRGGVYITVALCG